jgi:hypothetical protein
MKWSRLLIVLRLLVIVSLRLIIVVWRNTSRANAKSNQLGRSQRAVGVRDVGELLERLIPLVVNNLLVAPHNLKVLIHHIQTLISAPACGKDTPEHLQDARVGSKSRGSTTTVGSVRMSSSKTSTRSPWILRHYWAKRIMMHILKELLLRHRLNWMYEAKPQDLRGLVAMFHISFTMYSKTSKHTGFMRASSKFLS